jgi:copper chaperone
MTQTTQLQITIPDMDCAGCVSSITAAVKRIDAHATVAANLETKHVTIDSTNAAAELTAAIENAGYTVEVAF